MLDRAVIVVPERWVGEILGDAHIVLRHTRTVAFDSGCKLTPAGHITGLDLSPEQAAYAREVAKESGLPKYISFKARKGI